MVEQGPYQLLLSASEDQVCTSTCIGGIQVTSEETKVYRVN